MSLEQLATPQAVLILLAVGSILILVEVMSPGGWIAGGVGVALFALAGFALYTPDLEFSWLGLILTLAGLAMLIKETADPEQGIFGAAGVVAFIVGGFLMFDDTSALGLGALGVTALFMSVSVAGVWYYARKARNIRSAPESARIVGEVGVVKTTLAPRGAVQVANELWTAESDSGETIESGESVMVSEMDGLVLKVFRNPLQ